MENFRFPLIFTATIFTISTLSACNKPQSEVASSATVPEARQSASKAVLPASPAPASALAQYQTGQPGFKDVDALLSFIARNMSSYDEEKLSKMLENFNQQQLKSHAAHTEYADTVELPEGAAQVEFQDGRDYFSLEMREILKPHTTEVDEREDQFRTIFFDKKSMKIIADVPAKSQAMDQAGLHIAIGERESCMGIAPGESFSIFDLKQGGKVYHQEKLPDQPYRFDVKSLRPGIIEVTTRSESEFTGPEKEKKQCEIGSWVNVTESSYTLACDAKGGSCTVQKKIKRRAACSETGACD